MHSAELIVFESETVDFAACANRERSEWLEEIFVEEHRVSFEALNVGQGNCRTEGPAGASCKGLKGLETNDLHQHKLKSPGAPRHDHCPRVWVPCFRGRGLTRHRATRVRGWIFDRGCPRAYSHTGFNPLRPRWGSVWARTGQQKEE